MEAENHRPLLTPPGVSQENLTSKKKIAQDIEQPIVRAPGLDSGDIHSHNAAINGSRSEA